MRLAAVALPQNTSRPDPTAGAHLVEPMLSFQPPAPYASHYDAGHTFCDAWNVHRMPPQLPFIYSTTGYRAQDIVIAGYQPNIQPQTTWPTHVQDYNSFPDPRGFSRPAQPHKYPFAMSATWQAPVLPPGGHPFGSQNHYEPRVPKPRKIAGPDRSSSPGPQNPQITEIEAGVFE